MSPQTGGALDQHVKRAFHQLRQYRTACDNLIGSREPIVCGWECINEEYIPTTTESAIAPDLVI